VEGRKYPWFATQWHPEKTPYEFTDRTIPHSRTAIQTAWSTASVFVDVARLNNHFVPYKRQVKMMIDNYHRHFLAADSIEKRFEPLPDTLWFIPNPKRPREYRKGVNYQPSQAKTYFGFGRKSFINAQ
jgi:gamma-glutamyl hydrolase